MSDRRPSAIIDLHTHVIADDPVAYPLAPLTGKQSDWSRERPVTWAGMIQAMDAAGVDKVALVQASTCYGNDNRYVAESVAARPGRYIGVYSVSLTDADAVERFAHWRGLGLHGARVFVAGHTAAAHAVRLDDERGFPVWQYAQDHDVPVCVQLRAAGLPQLEAVLERFPGVRVLLDHFARPALEEGPPYAAADSLFRLARHPRLYFKLTAHNVRESREGKSTQAAFMERVVREFGASRIAWGSNFPASSGSLGEILAEGLAATESLSDDDREWIFHRTAESIYPALAGQAQGSAK